jgi:hypothetical protein
LLLSESTLCEPTSILECDRRTIFLRKEFTNSSSQPTKGNFVALVPLTKQKTAARIARFDDFVPNKRKSGTKNTFSQTPKARPYGKKGTKGNSLFAPRLSVKSSCLSGKSLADSRG